MKSKEIDYLYETKFVSSTHYFFSFVISYMLTFLSGLFAARHLDSNDVTVLLPTPPLPESTSSLFRTEDSLSFTNAMPGSGCLAAPDEHSD